MRSATTTSRCSGRRWISGRLTAPGPVSGRRLRRISSLYSTYNYEFGVDLRESLRLADVGDIFVIPANIEKSFDQIARAVSHVVENGVFPVILGGDHSIGYPDVRGIAPHIDGNVGIIHLDRHVDIQEKEYTVPGGRRPELVKGGAPFERPREFRVSGVAPGANGHTHSIDSGLNSKKGTI